MAASSRSKRVSQVLRAFVKGSKNWFLAAAAVFVTVFFLYCWQTFREIQVVMGETPVSQPTIIYSDSFVLRKGAPYAEQKLNERIRQLNLSVQESSKSGEIRWSASGNMAPEAALEDPSATRPAPGAAIEVISTDGVVAQITVDGKETESLALEPLMIAQLAGTFKSIRDYVPLDDIPTILKESIISIEDQRFREHYGFDPKSLLRALVVNLRSRSLAQGGSTITQQLVKNLLQSNKKTIYRKLRELILAVFIELRYEKEQILEKYLNEVYFGQIGSLEIHGVADAAKYFFNKPLQRLSIAEMALIAGVIRGPAVYSPYRYRDRALARKDVVLHKLAEQLYIAKPDLEAALHERLNFAPPSHGRNIAPYFADYVKAQVLEQLKDRVSQQDLAKEGLRIYTTLDPILQKYSDQAVASSVKDVETRLGVKAPLRLEGLLVVAQQSTGRLRALVGGRSYSETTFNRALNMKRSGGSTFKPFVYLSAFAKGQDTNGLPYTASYLVDDSPYTLEYDRQSWSPQNYDRAYRGRITLREAFINSVNVPAAKIAIDVGLDQIVETAHKLGITSELMAVPSMALGTPDVSAIELLQAYSTIANMGKRIEITAVTVITDKEGATVARFVPREESIFEPGLFELVTNLMGDVTRNGTAKSLASLGYKRPSYGKTGTTSFYRDSWFAGFSQGLTAISWVGFDELKGAEDNKLKLTGTSAALPLWARFFAQALPGDATTPEAPFQSLQIVTIDRTKNCKASNTTNDEDRAEESYLQGTVPDECPGL